MPEFRQDPVTGRTVIIAPDRARRPIEFDRQIVNRPTRTCPFCIGNEHLATGERFRIGDEEWRVRAILNLYPALTNKSDPEAGQKDSPLFAFSTAVGRHDVIIESPEHVSCWTQLSQRQIEMVLSGYQRCYAEAAEDPTLVAGLLFKNSGVAAGISLEHVHSQFVAFPLIPDTLQTELAGSLTWHEANQTCVFCELLQAEIRTPIRLVVQTENFVVLCPFASRFPWEIWILPMTHQHDFRELQADAQSELAHLLQATLRALQTNVENIAYNLVIHSSPFDSSQYDHYHWHIEILPRLSTVAGLEWGSGIHVNTMEPEQSASLLRAAVDMPRE